MSRSLKLLVFAIAAAAALYLALAPRALREPAPAFLPWEIEVLADGSSRVFGIHLGHSTLREAQTGLGAPAGVALFATPQRALSAEAYYEEVRPASVNGRLALTLAIDQGTLARIEQRAVRRRPLPEGGARLTPLEEDRQILLEAPIVSLAFVPHARLDEEVLLGRFGEPAERIRVDEHRTHWLYPERGLDAMLDAKGREVLQYVAPRDFERLREPLREHRAP
jgi:hypothetical protein